MADGPCRICGRDRRRLKRGMCSADYEAWRQGRLPLPDEPPVVPVLSIGERFWSKVDKSGECWEWTGNRSSGGYGVFWLQHGVGRAAHRYLYQQVVGAVPDDLDLDHLCRNRACVRPTHLEPVTRRENLRRGVGSVAEQLSRDHCRYGHPYDAKNTYMEGTSRRCRTCGRLRATRKREARRMAGAASG